MYQFRSYDVLTPHEVRYILHRVRTGFCSARFAADILDWTLDDVQMAASGRIVL